MKKNNDWLYEQCQKLSNANTASEFQTLTQSFTEELGFKGFLYATLPTAAIKDALHKTPASITTFDMEWINFYTDKKYYAIDPLLQKALSGDQTTTIATQKSIQNLTPNQKRIYLEATEAGLATCAHIPLHNSFGAISTLTLSHNSTHDQFINFYSATSRIVKVFAHSLNENTLIKDPKFFLTPSAPTLTSKEKEALQWLADGYTYEEVAYKMTIGASTIRKHTAKIFEKLNANNMAHATALAVKWHIIK